MTSKYPFLSHDGMLDDAYWSTFSSDFGDYELGPAIGFGASSTVYAAVFRSPQAQTPIDVDTPPSNTHHKPALSVQIPSDSPVEEKDCAIKISSSYPDFMQFFKETRMLAMCKHPNVLRVLAGFTLPPDHHRIAIVTPLITGGSLSGILDWRSRLVTTPKSHNRFPFLPGKKEDEAERETVGKLTEEECKAVVKQVLDGLIYLHTRGFLHRDLKAGNLLIQPDGMILLADFGVGGNMNDPQSPTEKIPPAADLIRFDRKPGFGTAGPPISEVPLTQRVEASGKRKSFVGTPSWMAPEVILGQKYDQRADIWSLGITILELAHGSVPGFNSSPNDILKKTVLDNPPTLDRSTGHYTKTMKEFVDLCLVKDPVKRPSAETLLDHPWLKGAKKKVFLAEALLAQLPSLEARQEIRRVPTVSSLASRTSSWDFSAPNSPIRSSLLIPTRSPSTFSQLDLFPSHPSRPHSRSSSRIPSLPPSPRVPLRQWAERTASEVSDPDSVQRRTMSETGKRRSGLLKRGQNTSFDFSQTTQGALLVPGPRKRQPSIDGGLSMSPVAETSLATPNQGAPIYMTASTGATEPLTNGFSPMGITDVGTPLSASPEDVREPITVTSGTKPVPHLRGVPEKPASSNLNSHPHTPTDTTPKGQYHHTNGQSQSEDRDDTERGRKGWLGRRLSVKKEMGEVEGRWTSGISSRLKLMRNDKAR